MQKRIALRKGTVLQSRYRILRRLGSGGMGAVYEAEDVRLKNRLVALKETFADDDETRHAFEREAELLANTEHDAFPCVIDYFTEAEGCFLVMELVRGEDLQEILKRRDTPFEEDRVLEWADQILDALEDLHRQKIVHRDIKPANLKLTPRGRIKLLDFGIAKGNAGEPAVTTIGSFAATLQYAPLEQVLRADSYYHQILSDNFGENVETILRGGTDVRSDLYALGATIYQLVTKRLPKNAPTRATAVWSGQKDKLIPADKLNPRVSPQVAALLQKLLELEPENRPASAADTRRLIRKARAAKFKAADEILIESNEIESPAFQTLATATSFEPETADGILNVQIVKQNFVSNAPKFESISGSKRISLVVSAIVLITIIGMAFALSSKQNASELSESPQSIVETKQPNSKTNAERENKLKYPSQQPKTAVETHKSRTSSTAAKQEAKLVQPPETVSPPQASRQRIIVDKSKPQKIVEIKAEDFNNGAN